MNYHELLDIIPQEQQDKVFNQDCDIDYEFLGFTKMYKHLSFIIPKHYVIIDLGCAYNAQCYYFKEHKKYIAVDISDIHKFSTDNCKIYKMTIKKFIEKHISKFDLEETFAICSYVPSWGADNMKLVRESFKNVFTYYPHGMLNMEKVKKFKNRIPL